MCLNYLFAMLSISTNGKDVLCNYHIAFELWGTNINYLNG
jgi:hypothetical protein